MAFKQFSGRKNLVIDLGISGCISLIIGMAKGDLAIGSLIGSTIGAFFLFFFWSWRPQHVKSDKHVRGWIHALCIFMLSITSFWVWCSWIYSPDSVFWPFQIVTLIWGACVAIKYQRLLWPRPFQMTSPKLKNE